MGLIFDIQSAKLYEKWCSSSKGLRMEAFFERLFTEFLKPKQYERVIDIGCGTGNHLLYPVKLGLSITGIDPSPYMLDLSRKRVGGRCELKKAYAEDIPYGDNEFDIAILINTLEFIDDPLKVLREAGRVAKREVFIIVFNSFSRYCRWEKINSLFYKNLFSNIRTFSLWKMKSLINQAYGSVPVRWRSEYLFPAFMNWLEIPFLKVFPVNHLPFGCLLGISVTLKYRYKTDNLFIKEKIPGGKRPVVEGIQSISNTR